MKWDKVWNEVFVQVKRDYTNRIQGRFEPIEDDLDTRLIWHSLISRSNIRIGSNVYGRIQRLIGRGSR